MQIIKMMVEICLKRHFDKFKSGHSCSLNMAKHVIAFMALVKRHNIGCSKHFNWDFALAKNEQES